LSSDGCFSNAGFADQEKRLTRAAPGGLPDFQDVPDYVLYAYDLRLAADRFRPILGEDRGLRNEPVSPTVERLDELRLAGIFPKRVSKFLNARSQCGIGHGRAGPHCPKELILGDYLSCPGREFPKYTQGLRADMNFFSIAPEPLCTVQLKRAEANHSTLAERTHGMEFPRNSHNFPFGFKPLILLFLVLPR